MGSWKFSQSPHTSEIKNVNRLSLKNRKEFTDLLIDIRMNHQLFKESFTRVFSWNQRTTSSNNIQNGLSTRLWHFISRTYCKSTFSPLTIVKSKYRVTLKNVGDPLLRQIFSQDLIFNTKINTIMDKNKINEHVYLIALIKGFALINW